MKFKSIILILLILQISILISEIIWEVDYGNMGHDTSIVHSSIARTSDGGYILIGMFIDYEFFPYNEDLFQFEIKINDNGEIVWDSIENYYCYWCGVFETDRGYSITVGSSRLRKRDENGEIIWDFVINDFVLYHYLGNDNTGFFVIGRNLSNDFPAIRKIDFDGSILWNVDYSILAEEDYHFIRSGGRLSNGSFVIGISDDWQNYGIMSVDPNGEVLWIKYFNDIGIVESGLSHLFETSEQEIIFTTSQQMIKMDFDGNILDTYDHTYCFAIDLPTESSFLAVTGSDYVITKYDYNFNQLQEISDYSFLYLRLLPDNGFLLYNRDDIHLIRTNEELVSTSENSIPISEYHISNYPNPFNPNTTIEFSIQNDSEVEISIFNIKGQKIKTLADTEFIQGIHSIIWNGEDELSKSVSSGIYYYKLNVNDKTEAVKKCLLLK